MSTLKWVPPHYYSPPHQAKKVRDCFQCFNEISIGDVFHLHLLKGVSPRAICVGCFDEQRKLEAQNKQLHAGCGGAFNNKYIDNLVKEDPEMSGDSHLNLADAYSLLDVSGELLDMGCVDE